MLLLCFFSSSSSCILLLFLFLKSRSWPFKLLLCNRCFALRWLPNQKSLHLSLSLSLLFLRLGIDARELETLRRLNRIQRLFRGTVQCEPQSFLVEGEALAFFLSGLGSSRLHPHAHTHTHTESTTAAATKRSVLFLLFLIRYYVDITRRWQRSNCGMYRLRLAPLLKEKKLSRTVTSGSVDDGKRPDDPSTLR